VQHTHKFWCYPIATVTIIYVLYGNIKVTNPNPNPNPNLNPIYC